MMFSINKTARQLRKRQNFEYPVDDLCLPGSTDKYYLVGVIVHEGLYRDTGHYYAIVRYQSGIFKCNDRRISLLETDARESMSCPNAYILIYRRKNIGISNTSGSD